jgi:hypothetical protein
MPSQFDINKTNSENNASRNVAAQSTLRGLLNVSIKKIYDLVKVQLTNSAGTEIGTVADPVNVTGTVTGTVPLPTGAATAALQTAGNASLTSIAAEDFATQTTLATRASEATLALVYATIGNIYTTLGSQATAALQTTGNGLLTDIKALQTSGAQKSQQVDGSGNVQPAGTTQPLGVNVIIGDGANKVDALAVADTTSGKRGLAMYGANSTGSARLFSFASDFIADGKSPNVQMLPVMSFTGIYNGSTEDKLRGPSAGFDVQGASPQTVLATAGAGKKNRLHELTITSDTTGLITISDGVGRFYLLANMPMQISWIQGKLQSTANTAITITNAAGGNVTAEGTYNTE